MPFDVAVHIPDEATGRDLEPVILRNVVDLEIVRPASDPGYQALELTFVDGGTKVLEADWTIDRVFDEGVED